jgi:molecular chaperone DnaK
MRDEAKANEESDKKRREEADKVNGAEAFCFQTKKQVEEMGESLSEENKKVLEEKNKALEDALASKDLEKIEAAQKDLQESWYKISAEIYAQQNPENPLETVINPDETVVNPE